MKFYLYVSKKQVSKHTKDDMYEFNTMNSFLPYLVNLKNILSIISTKYYYKHFCTLSK